MQWRGRRESGNVDDQRGSSGGGGFGGLPIKGGLGLIAIVVIFGLITGQNPLALLQDIPTDDQTISTGTPYESPPEEEELSHFVKVVLADTEDVWHDLMPAYRNPTLVLFTGEVQSGCGSASASTGPFYCNEDEKLYIDLSFYSELKDQFNAPGDFAQAYVIAHEVGHHVQHLLGIIEKVHAAQADLSEEEYNKLSVRLELQADFLAGVWANHANSMSNIIEQGDFEEAINAASAIGDDRLQKQFQGRVTPDSFTHGTSEQRVRWFSRGFRSGDVKQGDTFNVKESDL
ncbi:MAG TPA: neutral zinc metallopeptidase [Cyclobacteriaceae bacterium]|nr:neutral zinc metallopeptidase [Cyclobacteriaceae bacterium]